MPSTDRATLKLLRAQGVPLEERDDDALMQLSRAGVMAAWEVLVRRHQGALRGYCARVCGSALGDEVAQEVLLAVWAERERYQAQGRFRAYLFLVAARRARNALRSHKRASERGQAAVPVDFADPLQLDMLLARERERRLFGLLEKLPEDQRASLLLRYAAELDYDEIALVVERPSATVRSRVFLGLKRLRQLLQGKELP
ncbi:MAG: RNA polymerase sigma factor [Myxococcales bacterium]